MRQQISKKIVIYLFLFILLVTINNTNFLNFNFLQINNLNISGLSSSEEKQFKKDFYFLKKKNLLILNKIEISDKILENKVVEDLSIFKNYPSELKINIKKTRFLAVTQKNNQNYYIGSNGKLILVKDTYENLPFIFGDVQPENFLKLKAHIDNSKFNFDQVKNLYFFKSKRWDIETKNGLIIKLPLSQIKISLNNFSEIIVLDKFKDKKMIDLRQKDQIIFNE